MRADQRKGSGNLVAFPALHADEPVLDHVEPSVSIAASDIVHSVDDLEEAHGLSIERARDAVLE